MSQYWEIVMNWTQDGEVAQNVLHYVDSAPASIDWQEVTDVIANNFVTAFTDILVPSCVFTGISVREDVDGAVGQTYAPTGGSIAGGSTQDQYSHILSILVRKSAVGNVRPVKGRLYQPGVTAEGLDDTGQWATGYRTAVKDFWDDMKQHVTINSGTFNMVIKSRDPSKPNTNPYNVVQYIGAGTIPSTQKRRRIGRS